MREKRGDEIAEEGLSMGGFSTEMAVFEMATSHGESEMTVPLDNAGEAGSRLSE